MKTRTVLIAAALLLTATGALFSRPVDDFFAKATTKPDNCVTCHRAMEEASGMKYTSDIHYKKGISCAGCHGGDPTTDDQDKAMSPASGFIGVPKGDDISKTCQKCHSDAQVMQSGFRSAIGLNQLEDLDASVHGKAVTSGQGRLAQCVTCHGVHNIKSVTDPQSPVHPLNVNRTCASCHSNAVFMRSYNPALPIDQEEKYRTSVHGMRLAKGDSKVAVCSSCHGSHNILKAVDAKSQVNAINIPATCGKCHANAEYMKPYGIPTDQLAEFRTSVHGQALLEKHDLGAPSCNDCHGNHGAAPPDVESISKVCGTCHAMNASLFAESPHKKAYDDLGLPECETCHGNHAIVSATDALLGTSDDAVCSRCHSASDNPKGYQAAGLMRSMIDTLETEEKKADSLVTNAEQKGMEISEAKFKLRDIRQARLQSRTMVHAFNPAKFAEVVDPGIAIARTVAGEGQASIDEYYFRRYGLGVATLIITIVAIALYLVIKRIEKKQAEKA
jgi:predicted CXXCH cytochrome family protein